MSLLTLNKPVVVECWGPDEADAERELARFMRERMVLQVQLRANRRDPVFRARVQGRLVELGDQIGEARLSLAESLRAKRAARRFRVGGRAA